MWVDIIGFAAGATSTISLVPQLWRTYQTRSSHDLSYGMLWIFVITSALWIAYGVLTRSAAVWMTNVILVIFSFMLLIMKHHYDRHNEVLQ